MEVAGVGAGIEAERPVKRMSPLRNNVGSDLGGQWNW